jgi:hypothetical protein
MVATIRIPAIDGLIQRLGIIFIFIWIGVMSLKMLKLNMKKKMDEKVNAFETKYYKL